MSSAGLPQRLSSSKTRIKTSKSEKIALLLSISETKFQ